MHRYFLNVVGKGRIFKDRVGELHNSEGAARDAAAALGRELDRELGAQHGYQVELLDDKRRLIARLP